ncbi:hypothetical protein PRIPAC_72671 [Pristionchus pacificus]|uniref:Uncharacterized protein n=1 Tax=Pristionchus pacificus TaxID=54126 RepID=A0A2A6BFQ8_PRIPA|nr:hypothetical protein PRIPAC_72671 [Pristionchus pacificus]|eukprot:PDM64717.1 hypothetical protein PRIPAC_52973 [Pristionchus pacificus]
MLPTSASYSIQNGSYQSSSTICCGLFPIKIIARIFALYILITLFTIVCVLFTLHATSLVYGVFLENRTALVPFLGIGIVLCIFAFLSFLLLGLTTSFISEQHIHNVELRELYERHGWNPDDEKVRRLGPLLIGLFALLNILFQIVCWWTILTHYNHLDPSSQFIPSFSLSKQPYLWSSSIVYTCQITEIVKFVIQRES